MAKAWLSGRGVPFTEFNVSTDREAGARLQSMGYRSTPVIRIGDEMIVGFSPTKIAAACNTYGL